MSATTPDRTPAPAATLLARVDAALARPKNRAESVIILQDEPRWVDDSRLRHGDRLLRITPCMSVLAVLCALADHAARGDGSILIILTDLPEAELGDSILSRCRGQRIYPLDRWDLVARTHGVSRIDPRLRAIPWMAEALLDASPYPTMGGGSLTFDAAYVHLARRWLHLSGESINLVSLLDWQEQGRAASTRLDDGPKRGLSEWLVEVAGLPAEVVLRAVATDPTRDPIAVGVVCGALWDAEVPSSADLLQARGRAESILGGAGLGESAIRGFGEAAETHVVELQASGEPTARHRAEEAIDAASRLLTTLHALDSAKRSRLLPIGFDHRLTGVATSLSAWLSKRDVESLDQLEEATAWLRAHARAQVEGRRVERAEMALRLARWLSAPTMQPATVVAAIAAQIGEWASVDWALAHVFAGDSAADLAAAYSALTTEVRVERTRLDKAFADRLAVWTHAGSDPGDMLVVERIVSQVVAPLAKQKPTLLIVVDGLSAAIASELATQITNRNWVEVGLAPDADVASRRGAVAALPTVTRVSRTSLFAGELTSGDQTTEAKIFPDLACWGHGASRLTARLFHKGGIPGGAGHELAPELMAALDDAKSVVAVVLNAVDEALVHGRDTDDATWTLEDVRLLRPLLNAAASAGRAVVLTSDHGHIWDRGTEYRPGEEARYRAATGEVASDEVLLDGPRVVAPGHRIIAPWSENVRYAAKNAGYHGGASLAEVTIPLLVFVRNGADIPAGWAPVADPTPSWWSRGSAHMPGPSPRPENPPLPLKRRRSTPLADNQETLTFPEPEGPGSRIAKLVADLLTSEVYAVQRGPVKDLSDEQVGATLASLLEARGPLSLVALAGQLGLPPTTAEDLVSHLQRLLNVDGYPVLSLADDGRAIKLDDALLRDHFGLSHSANTP